MKTANEYEIENKTLHVISLTINFFMIPSNILTYRSRLLTMKVLKQVKMHKDFKGKGYNSKINLLNAVFWGWPPYAKLEYHKFLLLRVRMG